MSWNLQYPWDSQFPEDGGWGGIELGPRDWIRQHARARLLVETHLPPLGQLALCVCWGVGACFVSYQPGDIWLLASHLTLLSLSYYHLTSLSWSFLLKTRVFNILDFGVNWHLIESGLVGPFGGCVHILIQFRCSVVSGGAGGHGLFNHPRFRLQCLRRCYSGSVVIVLCL